MHDLKVIHVRVDELTPAKRNTRKHSRQQLRKLSKSIEQNGFNNPVLVTADRSIICGHARVDAARILGFDAVPAIVLDHLTAEQVRVFAIAENKLHDLSEWSDDLVIEIADLSNLDIDLDLTDTGFDMAEIDLLIMGHEEAEVLANREPDWKEPDEDAVAVARVGDIFTVGPHRLACGDARDPDLLQALMGTGATQMVITDPPYNVATDGHVTGNGRVKHRQFPMANGELAPEEFVAFLSDVMKQCVGVSSDESLHYFFMDHRHIGEITEAGSQNYAERRSVCVWVKGNGGMG